VTRALLAAVLTVATLLGPVPRQAPPLHVLTVGDSITLGDGTTQGAYRAELGRLLGAAGVDVSWSVAAVAGSRCTDWPARLPAVLDAERPDLVLIGCGTNDDTATPQARDRLAVALRTMWEAVKVRGARLGVALAQYPDLSVAPAWLEPSIARANDVAWSQLSRYYLPHPGWVSGVADLQAIPGTAETLDGTGFHPTPYGYRLAAALWYRALAADLGWPDTVAEPCGLSGHRIGYPRAPHTPCH
jgi:lysophospholipase L1-like esterase